MIVACACNDAAPRHACSNRTFCGRCGVRLEVLLTTSENKERIARGVTLAAWFAAPRTPPTRAGCETRNEFPACAHLRCRYNLGEPAAFACALEHAEHGPLTLDHVGRLMQISRERVRQIEERAIARAASRVTDET